VARINSLSSDRIRAAAKGYRTPILDGAVVLGGFYCVSTRYYVLELWEIS
jgi:hypothetical protein